ncbi:MAG: hypothetical protein RLZZ290_1291, partial [Pseudomonadota bacterium]
MGSPCEILLEGADDAKMALGVEAAEQEIARIEQKYSRYQPQSLLSLINAQAGVAPVPIDAETASLLKFADQLYRASEGLFDITSGVLRRAWRLERPSPPTPQETAALLGCIGWERVQWSESEAYLPTVGMEIDFGGFGKEYAVDRAADLLSRHGLVHGYVNLGG